MKVSVAVEPDLLQFARFLHFLDAHHFDVIQVTYQRHHELRLSVPQAKVHLLLLRNMFWIQTGQTSSKILDHVSLIIPN